MQDIFNKSYSIEANMLGNSSGLLLCAQKNKAEVGVKSIDSYSFSQRRVTPAGSPPNRFTEAKQNKTVSLNTSAQGHQLQSHDLIRAALHFVISAGVDYGSGSILLLPSDSEQCQRNLLAIRVCFKQSV